MKTRPQPPLYHAMIKYICVLFCSVLCLQGLKAQSLAFPTAEGYGKYTSGGRGGTVYTVTNLNDSGKGSFRYAIEQKGARTVIFAIDGTIELQSKLIIYNDSITIAGQTAPGDGICLKGYPFYIKANNVIVRYIRSRMGDINKMSDDAMGGRDINNLIIDHCTLSWSIDECLSVYRSENITIQWCMVANSLYKSAHAKGAHGFGGIWGGKGASFHHNLLAHNSSRNPRFASDGYSPVDFRNNVVYNWGFKAAYGGGRHGKINFVANYYKPGPATSDNKKAWFLDPAEDGSGSYYLSDNVMYGSDAVTADNWLGVGSENRIKAEKPFDVVSISQESAETAYKRVLQGVGCSLHRDNYDRQVIKDVETGTADVGETYAGGHKGIIDSQSAVGGWPRLAQGKYAKDSDGDGMPDWWEEQQGLNPNDPKDGCAYPKKSGYTNLEIYMNSIVADNTQQK